MTMKLTFEKYSKDSSYPAAHILTASTLVLTAYTPMLIAYTPALIAYTPVLTADISVLTAYTPVLTAYTPVLTGYIPKAHILTAYRPASATNSSKSTVPAPSILSQSDGLIEPPITRRSPIK